MPISTPIRLKACNCGPPLAAMRSLLAAHGSGSESGRIDEQIDRMDEIVRYQLRKPAASVADNLVLADTNEEGANMLALQTRQQLSTTALSLASQADQAVLSLF